MGDFYSEKCKIYEDLGFLIIDIVAEKESAEYCAFQFTVNNKKMLFRKSKVTPTKNGQFVTLWKRQAGSFIAPFSEQDAIAVVVVYAEKDKNSGYFMFSSSILSNKNIFSANGKEGKRAFRVYPPWDLPQNKQAAATQKWQLDYFVASERNTFCNTEKALELFSGK